MEERKEGCWKKTKRKGGNSYWQGESKEERVNKEGEKIRKLEVGENEAVERRNGE